ncbi:hypothetical protein F383_32948 [Gossypium arboreum]|uniref:Uncharacterized protein n=1 Tax=Gossypium arboreum TaxID=29729 RepID=A0A0B0MW55_GOSAR|nr:hypothetical protein F383_32948 [Gossypium arboreum]
MSLGIVEDRHHTIEPYFGTSKSVYSKVWHV